MQEVMDPDTQRVETADMDVATSNSPELTTAIMVSVISQNME